MSEGKVIKYSNLEAKLHHMVTPAHRSQKAQHSAILKNLTEKKQHFSIKRRITYWFLQKGIAIESNVGAGNAGHLLKDRNLS